MEEELLTPGSCRYELRSRTPSTPTTPGVKDQQGTPSTPIRRSARNRQPATPTTPLGTPVKGTSGGTPGFKTPMAFKPRLIGNKPVPSPSRAEIWKHQLGLTDEPSGSDKENTSDEEENNKGSYTSAVEHRALQRVLAEKDTKYDEVLMQLKNSKDKMRLYRTKLEREETTKRQQLKILRKTHENQMTEKDQLIDSLQSLLQEQEERIQQLEQTTTAPRKKCTVNPPDSWNTQHSGTLIEEIRRLQGEKSSLSQQLLEIQVELTNCQEDSGQKISYLQCLVSQLESGKQPNTDASETHSTKQTMLSTPCSTDSEKQVEVLQAENERLQKDILEAKNNHTKAVTVSKLAAHRQQQLEEELRRVKNELEAKTQLCYSVEVEKLESQVKTQQFEAEVLAMYAKQQEVNDTEKKFTADLIIQKRLVEQLQNQNVALQKTCEDKGKQLTEAEQQIKCLEKVVSVMKSEKEVSDQSFWKDMEDMMEDYRIKQEQMRTELQQEKDQALQQVRVELQSEKISELQRLRADLGEDHKKAVSQLMSEAEEGRSRALQDMKQELEDKNKQALVELHQQLKADYNQEMVKLREGLNTEKEEALQKQRLEILENQKELQTKYEQLVVKLSHLTPVLDHFVESYILLQKEVKSFPRLISKTVSRVQKEVSSAIVGISELNKDLTRKYQTEMKLRKKYHNELVELRGNIRVFCRVRPVIAEDGGGQQAENIVQLDTDDDGVLYVNSKQGRMQAFEVDKVFGETSNQEEVFEEVKALVMSCIDGYNVCIFAYGQTGSGKTYTMEGTKCDPGINQRALQELFAYTEAQHKDWCYTITVSVIEIYNEMIRDLLGDDTSFKMEVKMNPDGGLYIPGLSYVTVKSVRDVNEWFAVGQKNRATAATNMNEHSSRSHALLCVTVTGTNHTTNAITTGKLNLVDLAGSERVSKSKADGARLKEAQNINKSLSSLGDVINALRSKQSYVPYRNSKLTYMLQDSLGGDSKTLMITQVSPVRKNEGETICSLNFAQRVRNVELGAASRRVENGDLEDGEGKHVIHSDPASPARSTPQRVKTGTTLSTSKLTPVLRQTRKK